MIPDEAVEDAARVYRDQQAELGYPKWDDLPEWGREMRLELMRKALDAASPHLMAQAWDEAIAAAAERQERIEYQMQAPDESVDDAPLVNPYRHAEAGE